jgi:heme oxygenase
MTTGGQILAKRLKTHIFHLSEKDAEWDTKDGLNFYHFENIGNVPEFKEMYRERLNAARVDAATRGKREIAHGLFGKVKLISFLLCRSGCCRSREVFPAEHCTI